MVFTHIPLPNRINYNIFRFSINRPNKNSTIPELKLKTAIHVTIVAQELQYTELEHFKSLLKPLATVTAELSAQSYVHASEVSFN